MPHPMYDASWFDLHRANIMLSKRLKAVLDNPDLVAQELQHRAWAHGYTSGHSRAMRRMSDEPRVADATNPYPSPLPVGLTEDEKSWDEMMRLREAADRVFLANYNEDIAREGVPGEEGEGEEPDE